MWEITKDKDKGYFTDKDLDRIYWTLAFMSKGKVFNPNSTLDMVKYIENNGYNLISSKNIEKNKFLDKNENLINTKNKTNHNAIKK